MRAHRPWLIWLPPLALSLVLGACSSMRLVDTEVRSFGPSQRTDVNPSAQQTRPRTYVIDRLPSQQGADFDPIVTAVREALEPLSLRLHDPASPLPADGVLQIRYDERHQDHAPWDPKPSPFWGGFGWGNAGGGASLGWRMAPPLKLWFERELHLVMRRASDHTVVFETRARHDGVWPDTAAVLPAMLSAALRDYPQGHPEPRIIDIDIPR